MEQVAEPVSKTNHVPRKSDNLTSLPSRSRKLKSSTFSPAEGPWKTSKSYWRTLKRPRVVRRLGVRVGHGAAPQLNFCGRKMKLNTRSERDSRGPMLVLGIEMSDRHQGTVIKEKRVITKTPSLRRPPPRWRRPFGRSMISIKRLGRSRARVFCRSFEDRHLESLDVDFYKTDILELIAVPRFLVSTSTVPKSRPGLRVTELGRIQGRTLIGVAVRFTFDHQPSCAGHIGKGDRMGPVALAGKPRFRIR